MRRVVALVSTAALLAIVPSPTLATDPSSEPVGARPNIIVVMTDDMRVDDLAYAPNVRHLVQDDGITMENAFSSYPLCCPARATFLTGLLPRNHHVWNVNAPFGYQAFDDSRTIATSLQAAGYSTGLIGKYLNQYGEAPTQADGGTTVTAWHTRKARRTAAAGRRPARTSLPGGRTLASWRKIPAGWTDWEAAIEPTRQLQRRGLDGGTYDYYNLAESVNGVPTQFRNRYTTDVMGRQAIAMAKRFHAAGRPYFMDVSFVAPHCGTGNQAEQARNRREGLVGRETPGMLCAPSPARADRGRYNGVIRRGAGVLADGTTEQDADGDGRDTAADTADKPGHLGALPPLSSARDLAEEAALTRHRAEAVHGVDRQVGRLVHYLQASGQWEHTVLVFTSDNGYFQGEHHHDQGKVLGYEPVLRVPLLITGPGLRGRGIQKRYDPVDFADLSATVSDWAGAAPPYTPDGVSIVDDLVDGDGGWSTVVPIEQAVEVPSMDVAGLLAHTTAGDPEFTLTAADPRMSIGLRTARYSYVRYADGTAELYDLWTDPLEMSNLADDPGHTPVRTELDRVWRQDKDCSGPSCDQRLPADLRVSAADDAARTDAYWAAITAAYGHGYGDA